MAEEKGLVAEVGNSIKDNLSDKFSSPFWSSFIISWCLWNWKVVYATFFIDTEVLLKTEGVLKLNYISSLYQMGSVAEIFNTVGHLFIGPYLSSYLIVFYVSKVAFRFYKRSLEDGKRREEAKILISTDLFGKEKEMLQEKVEVLKEEVKLKELEAERPPEERWEEEYQKFKGTSYYASLGLIEESVYDHAGEAKWNFNDFLGTYGTIISADIKAYFDTSGIIKLESGGKISLTGKGRFFIGKYLEDSQKTKTIVSSVE